MAEDQALPGMEPEEPMAAEEPAGDPVPAPAKRKRGRPRKDAAAPSGSEPAAGGGELKVGGDDPAPPVRRASKKAIAGAQNLYGTAGALITVGGQISDTPGLIVGGFVVQSQAVQGGRVLAQRLAPTRWYPWLERASEASELAPLVIAPLAAAVYVEVPPLRPLLGGILADALKNVQPSQQLLPNGETVEVSALEVLERTVAEVDLARHANPMDQRPPMAAEPVYGPEPGQENGAGDPALEPEPPRPPSRYEQALGDDVPPAEAAG